jgi:hypothetical protein
MSHPIHQPALSQDVTLRCVDPWGRTVAVPTTLGFRAEDPYAVTLTFHSAGGDVEWIVSRLLLMQGLTTPSGEGDVRVAPGRDANACEVTVLDFCSPDGRLVAEVDAEELQGFLERSSTVVPIGAESRHLDIDALIADLLQADAA